MKLAVMSMAIGNKSEWDYCLKSQSDYCKKYGYDYFIETKSKINFINVYFDKFSCIRLLENYDRVLFLDADVLITPHARDIFKEYPDQEYIYAWNENINDVEMNRDSWIATYDPDFDWPMLDGRKRYFNTGCVLYSKKHKDLLTKIKMIPFTRKHFSIDGGEQTAINFVVSKENWKFKNIDRKFNWMNCGSSDPENKRLDADFIHYAGPCLYGNSKSEVIKSDYNTLYKFK
jgi:lipopolysaccharide biosynthesis glycosyltransferase